MFCKVSLPAGAVKQETNYCKCVHHTFIRMALFGGLNSKQKRRVKEFILGLKAELYADKNSQQ